MLKVGTREPGVEGGEVSLGVVDVALDGCMDERTGDMWGVDVDHVPKNPAK